MKQPLWIINSTLLLLLLIALFFIYVSRISLSERADIEPSLYSRLRKQRTVEVNIATIYEADLFGTYKMAAPVSDQSTTPTFPEPPTPQQITVPELPKPQFLEPLGITLKGIFVISTDSSKNQAIIMNNQTKKEATYRIGDKIVDAQLIRIFGNKVVLLRANGQQEILYVREMDAKLDTTYTQADEWSSIIKSISDTTFLVDPAAFIDRVPDLAAFIDMLHIITAYKNGKSVGCRIGQLAEKSVGLALGLQAGDIIVSIDGFPADTMENRLNAYKSVLAKKENEAVNVTFTRNKHEYTFEYILKDFLPVPPQKVTQKNEFEIKKIQEDERVSILKQKHEFAPTMEEIRSRERELMRNRGKMPIEQQHENKKEETGAH